MKNRNDPYEYPRKCAGCGRSYSKEEFRALSFVGVHWEEPATEEYPHLILRNCSCTNTMSVALVFEDVSGVVKEILRKGGK